MNRFFLLIILITLPTIGVASIQKPDKLIYDGRTWGLDTSSFLMEAYFEKHPEKKAAMKEGLPWDARSTGLWRDYVATFEIVDGKVLLKDLEIIGPGEELEGYSGDWVSVMDRVFSEDTRLHIDWFSDLLIFPEGELFRSESNGATKTKANYLLLDIVHGKVVTEVRQFGTKEEVEQGYILEQALKDDCDSPSISHKCELFRLQNMSKEEREHKAREDWLEAEQWLQQNSGR